MSVLAGGGGRYLRVEVRGRLASTGRIRGPIWQQAPLPAEPTHRSLKHLPTGRHVTHVSFYSRTRLLTVHTSKPASTELFKVKLVHNNNLECKRLDLQYSLPSTAFREAFFPANTRTSLRLTSIPNTRLKNHKKAQRWFGRCC